ncbi:Threonine synthase-like 2 [Merluccius polli]|uniref:Threonine synthase-like 2 n=1 Tax=Merluccius polli TaxID=89951 RepID=A0AA47M710_MERPO|nr:Threonine synthase-like 2 [Merluccius polli]
MLVSCSPKGNDFSPCPSLHSQQVPLMRYCSTRGGVHGLDLCNVLFSGFAPDGRMFMPESLPVLSPDTLRSWTGWWWRSPHIPTHLMPRDHLEALVTEALSSFTVPEVVRFAKLKEGLTIVELFHGNTLAFKDLAMTCTVRFLDYFLHKQKRRAIVLVGLAQVDVVVVYPRRRITPVQEKHMTTCLQGNIHVFADGTSDDVDVPLHCLFADQELVQAHGLMSLNSVNWSRIMIQLAHFIYAYLHMSGLEKALTPLFLAGCVVKQMGVPLRLVAMVNTNDIVQRTVQCGDLSMAADVKQTLAPAIDIQDPYNMERVFWLLSGRDGALVKGIMEDFQCSHRHTLPEQLHTVVHCHRLSAGTITDEGIMESMRRCWEQNQYLLCPHTAVSVWHHYHTPPNAQLNRCYLATASPAKFQSAVQRAGMALDLPESLSSLDNRGMTTGGLGCPPRDKPCPPYVNPMKTGEKNVYELRYCILMDVQLQWE